MAWRGGFPSLRVLTPPPPRRYDNAGKRQDSEAMQFLSIRRGPKPTPCSSSTATRTHAAHVLSCAPLTDLSAVPGVLTPAESSFFPPARCAPTSGFPAQKCDTWHAAEVQRDRCRAIAPTIQRGLGFKCFRASHTRSGTANTVSINGMCFGDVTYGQVIYIKFCIRHACSFALFLRRVTCDVWRVACHV